MSGRSSSRPTYSEPYEGEVRRSGFAFVPSLIGYVLKYPSCAKCAAVLSVVWTADFFEGRCQGCEVRLSGFPVNG